LYGEVLKIKPRLSLPRSYKKTVSSSAVGCAKHATDGGQGQAPVPWESKGLAANQALGGVWGSAPHL